MQIKTRNKPPITDIHLKFGFGYPRSTKDIQAIFIHTTENPFSGSAEAVGTWQSGGKASGNSALGSYHFLVDRDSLVFCNTDDWVAYGTGNRGNQVGLHISFVAQARSTREQWLDEERKYGTLTRGAWQVARWCEKHSIPVNFVPGHALRAGTRGISTHNEARIAWGITDHTDPGAGFPIDIFLDMVRQHMTNPDTTPPPPANDTMIQLMGPDLKGWEVNWLARQSEARGRDNGIKGTLVELIAVILKRLDDIESKIGNRG